MNNEWITVTVPGITAREVGGVVLPEAAALLADAAILDGAPEWTASDPGDMSSQSSFSKMS